MISLTGCDSFIRLTNSDTPDEFEEERVDIRHTGTVHRIGRTRSQRKDTSPSVLVKMDSPNTTPNLLDQVPFTYFVTHEVLFVRYIRG